MTSSGKTVALRIFVQPANVDKVAFAMQSLKRSMAWDEQVFGLEYDLELFNIVAVDDFNMGERVLSRRAVGPALPLLTYFLVLHLPLLPGACLRSHPSPPHHTPGSPPTTTTHALRTTPHPAHTHRRRHGEQVAQHLQLAPRARHPRHRRRLWAHRGCG